MTIGADRGHACDPIAILLFLFANSRGSGAFCSLMVPTSRTGWCGSFDIILGPISPYFPRIPPHAPCEVPYFVPNADRMLIVLAIRCYARV